jgi:hypothetical protein
MCGSGGGSTGVDLEEGALQWIQRREHYSGSRGGSTTVDPEEGALEWIPVSSIVDLVPDLKTSK